MCPAGGSIDFKTKIKPLLFFLTSIRTQIIRLLYICQKTNTQLTLFKVFSLTDHKTCDVSQKPLRRIDIEEVSGKLPVVDMETMSSEESVQEVVREESSPLSTSPTAKMIKIEEMPEVSTETFHQ